MDKSEEPDENQAQPPTPIVTHGWWRSRRLLLLIGGSVVLLLLLVAIGTSIVVTRAFNRENVKVTEDIAQSSTEPTNQETAVLITRTNDKILDDRTVPLSPSSSSSSFTFQDLKYDNDYKTPSSSSSWQHALRMNNINQGDPLQTAAIDTNLPWSLKVIKQSLGRDTSQTCFVQDASDLTDAVENQSCSMVFLVNGDLTAYRLTKEIIVRRKVLIQGHPAVLPEINAAHHAAERAFHVVEGGFLHLRHLRVRQGIGIVRERYGLERTDSPSKVREQRGGSIFFDKGALGGDCNGVIFISTATTAKDVQQAIDDTLNFVGMRIYGGHILMVEGTLNLLNCHFWDAGIFLPLTDVLMVGPDILVLGGILKVTGCTFTEFLLFGNYAGIGSIWCVLGGIAIFTFVSFQDQIFVESALVAGATTFVGGGIQIMTAVNFLYVTAVVNFMGIGSYMTGAGIMIMTGVTVENAFGILSNMGAGFFTTVGTGVLVQSGVTYAYGAGIIYSALTGGNIFVGTGSSINTGVLTVTSIGNTAYNGQGGILYGAGVTTWVGSPFAIAYATNAFTGLGGSFSIPAGLMIYLLSPSYFAIALNYFAGSGSIIWLGAGSAVLGYSHSAFDGALGHSNGNEAPYVIAGNNKGRAKGKIKYVNKEGVYGGPSTEVVQGRRKERYRQLRTQKYMTFNHVMDFWDDPQLGGEAAGKVALYNISSNFRTKKVDKEQRAKLATWVPKSILEAGDIIQSDLRPKIEAIVAQKRRRQLQEQAEIAEIMDQDTTVYIGKDTSYCGACNVDSISGPKAKECIVDCQQVAQTSHVQPEDFAGAESSSDFSWDKVSFDPHFLVIGEIVSKISDGLSSNGGSNDNNQKLPLMDLRDDLRKWVKNEGYPDVQVAVYPSKVDSSTFDWLDSAKSEDTDEGQQKLKFVYVAYEQDSAEHLKKAMKGDSLDSQGQFLKDAITSSFADAGLNVSNLHVQYDQTLYIPAYNSTSFFQDRQAGGEDRADMYSISLVDPSKEAVPIGLHELIQDEEITYDIRLAGFPSSTLLMLQLIGDQEVSDKKTTTASTTRKQTVLPIQSIQTEDSGHASQAWKIPFSLPEGNYYIKGVDTSGKIFAYSQMYTIIKNASSSSSSGSKTTPLYSQDKKGKTRRRTTTYGPL